MKHNLRRIINPKSSVVIFVLIVLIGSFFRFYNLNNWLIWGMDEENEIFISKNIATFKHFPLIGLSNSGTGTYRGPLFLYINAVLYILSGGNPFGGALFSSFLGMITVLLVYHVAKSLFSPRIGLFASILYAGSFLVSFYSRQFWSPTYIPFFSLLTGFLLLQISKGRIGLLPPLSLFFGIALHSHLSILVFIPLILYVVMKIRKSISRKHLMRTLLFFILTQITLIFFDLRHGFINLKALLGQFGGSITSTAGSSLTERLHLYISMIGRLYLPPFKADWFVETGQCKELLAYQKDGFIPGLFLIVVLLMILVIHRRHIYRSVRRLNGSIKLLLAIMGTAFLSVILYQGVMFEYYFLFLFPWIFIAAGVLINKMYSCTGWKLLAKFIISGYLLVNLISLISSNYSYSFREKLAALQYSKNIVGGNDYSLEAIGECPRFGGYRYLYEYYLKTPTSSYMDSYFSWLYDVKKPDSKEDLVVLLSMIDPRNPPSLNAKLSEDKLEFLSRHKILATNRFDNIQVYILKSI